MEKTPEGENIPGGDEKIVLTKDEHDALVNGTTSMKNELIELRKKNRELASQQAVSPDEIEKVITAELKKRDQESLKRIIDSATAEFIAAHPEFSPENDKDGLTLAAYQRALGRMNLSGITTKEDYQEILDDALRLTEKPAATTPMQPFSSPRSTPMAPGAKPGSNLPFSEQKLVAEKFNGNVETYLAWKAKHPEVFAEIIKYV